MNKYFTLALSIIVLSSCNNSRTDLEDYNLQGNVWKVKETTYEGIEKFGNVSIGEISYYGHSYYEFNENGNLKEYQTLDEKGNIQSKNLYSYNKDNVRTEITSIEDEKVTGKSISKIEDGKIKELQIYDEEGDLTQTYKYEYSGPIIKYGTILNENGSTKFSFINDVENGQLTKQTFKDSIGNFDYERTFIRNNYNDVITFSYSNPKDSIHNKYFFEYEYDKHNNWIKKFSYNKDKKIDDIVIRNIIYFEEDNNAITQNDFIGMWFLSNDNNWIEFRKDDKYDSGYSSKIKDSGIWEVDTDQQVLTLRANDPKDSKKYKFSFEGFQLVLYTVEGKEKLRLEKR